MGQREGGALSLPVIAGRTLLGVPRGSDAAANKRSTKAVCSASTVCEALGALARPESQCSGVRGGGPMVLRFVLVPAHV